MEEWLRITLSKTLEFEVPLDLTKYILNIEDEKNLDEYLRSLLDYNNPSHVKFVEELKQKKASSRTSIDHNKSRNEKNAKKKSKKGKNKIFQPIDQPKTTPQQVEKKKTKFVNLYSSDGQNTTTVQLKGRHKCNCEGKTHSLVNNCLSCGRIVCKQEGSGPCFYCGQLVCSPQEFVVLQNSSKQSDNLYNKLMDRKPGLEESVKQRDKLLEFDRNSARRTKVIDDESDYFQSSNTWLSTSEREKLEQREKEMMDRKHASRLTKNVTLDLVGRQVIEEEDEFYDAEFEDCYESSQYSGFRKIDDQDTCPGIEYGRPLYIESDEGHTKTSHVPLIFNTATRIQDKGYLEMADEGLCLSLHQPYASLLVMGIKIHEGRSWYTAHRGRLWIASASRPPGQEEITSLENSYRVLKDGLYLYGPFLNFVRRNVKFPNSYPTSSLLGCVTLTNVLPQEEYRKTYPTGESDSPYVLICENHYALPIKFPIQGHHKIYKLDRKIHQGALKALGKVMKDHRE